MTRYRTIIVGALAVALVCGTVSASHVSGATSGTVVGATVLSATSIDLDGCGPRVAGRTDFGALLPNSKVTTSADCAVTFGSSNDVARLRIQQSDRSGSAMFGVGGDQPSGLDGDGVVTVPLATPASATDSVSTVLPGPNGSTILVGSCAQGGVQGWDVCLARLTDDGSLDPTFGAGGIRMSGFAGTDMADDAVMGSDGSIVTVGNCVGFDGACLMRFTATGSLDTTFGVAGRFAHTATAGGLSEFPYELITTRDGGFATANICSGGPGGWDGCVAKFTATGARDLDFGTNGITVVAAAPTTYDDEMYDLVETPDGSIVTFGGASMDPDWGDFSIARMSSIGVLDPSFGGDGIVTIAMSSNTTGTSASWDGANAGVVLADGRIVAVGDCEPGGGTDSDACLVRLEANGALDTTFGGDGRVEFSPSTAATSVDNLSDIEVDAAGAYLVTGSCQTPAGGNDLCILRVLPSGTLDPTFGASGVVRQSIAPGTGAEPWRPVTTLLEDGALGVAGGCAMGGTTGMDACVLRLDGAATIPQYQIGVADWSTTGTSMFAACLRATINAAATWNSTGACATDDDSNNWYAVPPLPSQLATTATSATGTANLRFGMVIHDSQPPGALMAPITLSVMAP